MAARGAPLICSHGERNFVEAPLREHSRKPDEAARGAGADVSRACRRSNCSRASGAAGWDVWGDQVDMFEEAT